MGACQGLRSFLADQVSTCAKLLHPGLSAIGVVFRNIDIIKTLIGGTEGWRSLLSSNINIAIIISGDAPDFIRTTRAKLL